MMSEPAACKSAHVWVDLWDVIECATPGCMATVVARLEGGVPKLVEVGGRDCPDLESVTGYDPAMREEEEAALRVYAREDGLCDGPMEDLRRAEWVFRWTTTTGHPRFRRKVPGEDEDTKVRSERKAVRLGGDDLTKRIMGLL